MYVVSEITGKKYATVAECKEDEKIYIAKRKAAETAKMEAELDEAWENVVKAVDNFIEAAERINPDQVADIKAVMKLMKLI